MSIRTQILVPMLLVVTINIAMSAAASFMSGRDNARVALVTADIVEAGELSRKANLQFDRLGGLVAEVTAMTHFIAPAEIEKRFVTGADAMNADLEGLNAVALSPGMGEAARERVTTRLRRS